MFFTIDLQSHKGDRVRVSLSSIDKSLFPDEIRSLLGNVDIVEIILERTDTSSAVLPFSILAEIANAIGREVSQKDNIILYFYCDDSHDVSRRDQSLLPQQYRSVLFERIISRYLQQHSEADFVDSQLIYQNDNPVYIHLIYSQRYKLAYEVLKGFLAEMAVK